MTFTYGVRPSNGTEGSMQHAQTCVRCEIDHDGGWHDYPNTGDDSCPILMMALLGPHGPPEWGHDFETGEWECTAFIGPCDCTADDS